MDACRGCDKKREGDYGPPDWWPCEGGWLCLACADARRGRQSWQIGQAQAAYKAGREDEYENDMEARYGGRL